MISDAINSIINEQINKEFYSGYLYLSMSAHLKELGLMGFASWLRHQAKEEVEHGLKLLDYLLERNSFVTLKQIRTPEFEFNGIISIFNKFNTTSNYAILSVYFPVPKLLVASVLWIFGDSFLSICFISVL